MPANIFEARHYHFYAQQFFFVLAGTAVLEVDGEEIVLQSIGRKRSAAKYLPSADESITRDCGVLGYLIA